MSIWEAYNQINNERLLYKVPKSGNQMLKQPTSDWKVADKYLELGNFEIEVKNICVTNDYSTWESDRSW